jgi:RNA polymerase sigma-70 factor, ECF subfamily
VADSHDQGGLSDFASARDEDGLVTLFAQNRQRLRTMVQIRLDDRLKGRIDPSDVLQEAYLEIARRAPSYAAEPKMPPFLWIRFLVLEKLQGLRRRHLQKMRDPGCELVIGQLGGPAASSASLAELLLGRFTSPTSAVRRAEMQARLQELLNSLDPVDREILVLRHFEELTNGEAAHVLGLSKTGASSRYVRALGRLKALMSEASAWVET